MNGSPWYSTKLDLGRRRLWRFGDPLRYEWYDGGGFVTSHLIVRHRRRIVAIVVAAEC